MTKEKIVFEDNTYVLLTDTPENSDEIDGKVTEAIKNIIKTFPGAKPITAIHDLNI